MGFTKMTMSKTAFFGALCLMTSNASRGNAKPCVRCRVLRDTWELKECEDGLRCTVENTCRGNGDTRPCCRLPARMDRSVHFDVKMLSVSQRKFKQVLTTFLRNAAQSCGLD